MDDRRLFELLNYLEGIFFPVPSWKGLFGLFFVSSIFGAVLFLKMVVPVHVTLHVTLLCVYI